MGHRFSKTEDTEVLSESEEDIIDNWENNRADDAYMRMVNPLNIGSYRKACNDSRNQNGVRGFYLVTPRTISPFANKIDFEISCKCIDRFGWDVPLRIEPIFMPNSKWGRLKKQRIIDSKDKYRIILPLERGLFKRRRIPKGIDMAYVHISQKNYRRIQLEIVEEI